MNTVHPWSRQAGEGAKSFHYFTLFLEQTPPRSLSKVAQTCNRSLSLLRRFSARFNWIERALAYDQHQAELAAKQLVARRVQAQARQADRATVLSDTAMVAARRLVNRLQGDENAELSATEITSMFGTASRVEATALEFGQDKLSVNVVQVNNQPPPVVDERTALRAAYAFIACKTTDPELERLAMHACNELATGGAHGA